MSEVRQTKAFSDWMDKLRDLQAIARINVCIRRLSLGHFGDVKSVGDGLSELRIDHGPGYRVYIMRRGSALVILLCGGDKQSQSRDILRARELVKEE